MLRPYGASVSVLDARDLLGDGSRVQVAGGQEAEAPGARHGRSELRRRWAAGEGRADDRMLERREAHVYATGLIATPARARCALTSGTLWWP